MCHNSVEKAIPVSIQESALPVGDDERVVRQLDEYTESKRLPKLTNHICPTDCANQIRVRSSSKMYIPLILAVVEILPIRFPVQQSGLFEQVWRDM